MDIEFSDTAYQIRIFESIDSTVVTNDANAFMRELAARDGVWVIKPEVRTITGSREGGHDFYQVIVMWEESVGEADNGEQVGVLAETESAQGESC